MSDDRIRVLLAEDNFYTRLGTLAFLNAQAGITVVGEASDGRRALALFDALAPDVTVMGLGLPLLDGLQVTAAIGSRNPDAAVVIVAAQPGDEDVARALKVGARGYLGRNGAGDDLLAAIRAVHGGARYLPADIRERLSVHAGLPALTPRERQVLEQVAEGASNRETAAALGISQRTVGLYVSSILDKLGAQSRTEAVSIATHRGIIRPRWRSLP
jgi:DNA-binding NarL/FixJ family response regulator